MPTAASPSRWSTWICCGLCGFAGVAAFWPTRGHGFVYDDPDIVERNWIVTAPDAWYRFLVTSYWPPGSPREKRAGGTDKLYRPLTIGSLRAEYLLHGGAPGGYHTANAVLHGGASALVCLVATRAWATAGAGLPAGLIFAVHPVHVDAVAPIVGRSEILAAFFCLWLLMRHMNGEPLSGGALARYHLSSTLLFAAAVLSKEHALFVWPVVVAMDWRRRCAAARAERPPIVTWLVQLARRSHLGFAYVTAALFFMRFYIFGWAWRRAPESLPFWANPLAQADWAACVLTPFRLLWLSARLLLDPTSLSPLWNPRSLVPARSLGEPDVWGGMMLAAAVVAAIVWGARRCAPVAVWLFAFASFMVVPLHIVPMASWFFAERWLYLPSAALAVAAGGLVRRFGGGVVAAAIGLSFLLLPQTWSYAAAWRSDESMNRYVLQRHPDNFHAARNLGVVLLKAGRYEEVLHIASEMADRHPDAWEPYWLMVEAHSALGNAQQADEARRLYGPRYVEHFKQMR